MTDTPIKYIVKEKSLIGNELFEAGAEVTLPEGTLPAENLSPTCKRGEAKYQEYLESNRKRVAAMREANTDQPLSLVGDQEALAKMIGAAVATALSAQEAEQPKKTKAKAETPKPDSDMA